MKKYLLALCIIGSSLMAKNHLVTVDVTNVVAGDSSVYLAIYNSKDSLQKSVPLNGLVTIALDSTVTFDLSLAEGSYVFTCYQDLNGNGQLDFGSNGPIEPVGVSNFTGKGNPNDFDKLKTLVNSEKTVTVNLAK